MKAIVAVNLKIFSVLLKKLRAIELLPLIMKIIIKIVTVSIHRAKIHKISARIILISKTAQHLIKILKILIKIVNISTKTKMLKIKMKMKMSL